MGSTSDSCWEGGLVTVAKSTVQPGHVCTQIHSQAMSARVDLALLRM
jgi:hypothetical protein